jgi:putative methanogenesis marker protein 5
MNVLIYPPNSLILADLVERYGHKPLVLAREMSKKVRNPEIDSPPMNITSEVPKRGLRYAAVEVPAGVRGRLGLIGPLIDDAEAAIILHEMPYMVGCVGCARSGDLMIYLIRNSDIPTLEVVYPTDREEAKKMVKDIIDFLNGL